MSSNPRHHSSHYAFDQDESRPMLQNARPSASLLVRFGVVSGLAGLAYLGAVAIPTAIIPNPFFTRMTPPTPVSYVFWILPALLFGPLAASYVVQVTPTTCSLSGRMTTASVLSYLAVGCPICNKIVVLLLGISGALTYFQPLQPLLGLASVVLLAYALWLRFRGVARLGVPARS